jgi:Ras-related protein Rab-1A
MVMNYDYLFKLVAVGNHGVGKSCFIHKLSEGNFSSKYAPTIGVDLRVVFDDSGDGKRVKCHVWDTAGQEQFMSITRSYLKGAAGAFLMYDCSDACSFDDLDIWRRILHQECPVGLTAVVVECKNDKRRVIEREKGEQYANDNGMPFVSISSLNGEGVQEVIPRMCSKLFADKVNKGIMHGIRSSNPVVVKHQPQSAKHRPFDCCTIV